MDVFAALADPVRRSLLRSLRTGPARVVDLAAERPISRPAVSRHLRLLTEAGLVAATAHGRERHYAVVPAGLAEVAELLSDLSGPAAGITAGSRIDVATLDALDTEVRRASRDRRRGAGSATGDRPHEHEEIA